MVDTESQTLTHTDLEMTAEELGLEPEDATEETPTEQSEPDPKTEPEEPEKPTEPTEKTEDEDPEAEPEKTETQTPKDEVNNLLDEILNDEKAEKPETDVSTPQGFKQQLAAEEAKLKQFEVTLKNVSPMVNPDGSKIQDYKLSDGTSLFSLNKAQLNQVVTELQNQSDPVTANEIQRAYEQYQANKATIDKATTEFQRQKDILDFQKDNLELWERGQVWKQKFEASGTPITEAQIQKVDQYLAKHRSESVEFRSLPKDTQIQKAILESGVAKELRAVKAQKMVAAGSAAPDANVSNKSAQGTGSPKGQVYKASEIWAMSPEEWARNEAKIDIAMLEGRFVDDL